MNELTTIMLAAWLAGLAGFFGGLIAKATEGARTSAKQELTHGIIAFGGGILVAAIAFALIPQAMVTLSTIALSATFCAGGLLFSLLDATISRSAGNKAQFLAMLLDFLPEALALGAVFCQDQRLGILLAAFIGAQNLPEGFNAFREMKASFGAHTALTTLLGVSLLGPLAACAGYFFLQDNEKITASIMAFAGGGILYLIFQDIAPESKMKKDWMPALGAVLGFAVGMMGKQLLH